ncbi:hypothetical protein [Terasakiella pusilla]|uniref:LmrA/YxaF family transcription factor n=1 Tax=Terasakiella pusilla TaxID=64973 RepID=UPI003AA9A7EC
MNKKQILLDKTVQWLIENSADEFSLRRVASDINTSARMLVYHFGTRDKLLVEALSEIADQWMSGFKLNETTSTEQQIREIWHHTLSTKEALNLHRLSFQMWATGLATRSAIYQPFLKRVANDWIDTMTESFIRDGLAPFKAKIHATLIVSGIEGLLLQSMTDPNLPVHEAFEELIAKVSQT